jgi:hypothetical protein
VTADDLPAGSAGDSGPVGQEFDFPTPPVNADVMVILVFRSFRVKGDRCGPGLVSLISRARPGAAGACGPDSPLFAGMSVPSESRRGRPLHDRGSLASYLTLSRVARGGFTPGLPQIPA